MARRKTIVMRVESRCMAVLDILQPKQKIYRALRKSPIFAKGTRGGE